MKSLFHLIYFYLNQSFVSKLKKLFIVASIKKVQFGAIHYEFGRSLMNLLNILALLKKATFL